MRKTKAIRITAGLFILILLTAGLLVHLGVGRNGFRPDIPLTCSGGDDTSFLSEVKMMKEGGFLARSSRLGAPYGTDRSVMATTYLKMDISLLAWLFVKLTGSIGAAVNLTYFTVLFLVAIVSFLVLCSRKIRPEFAAAGGLTYAFLPYIFTRKIGHLMLSAYQFVPLAVLLCIWIFEDDRFLKFRKGFFHYRRNLLAFLFAGLIASNGIGYYPFFSCIILLAAGLSKSLKERKLSGLFASLKQTGLIAAWMALFLSPYIRICLTEPERLGENARQIGDVEQFALKLVRLFIPTFGSGIGRLDAAFAEYASVQVANWPAEATEYIGLMGTAGFVILIIVLLTGTARTSPFYELVLLSELNIVMILYGVIGGFSAFVFLFVTMSVRCTNRISVFIAFVCIYASCFVMDRLCASVERVPEPPEFQENEPAPPAVEGNTLQQTTSLKKQANQPTASGSGSRGHRLSGSGSRGYRSRYKKGIVRAGLYAGVLVTTIAGLAIQTRGWSYSNETFAESYELRDRFFRQLEEQLPEGAMVYELPYCSYPEGGVAGQMNADMQFFGYLHTDTVRWSYGALQGEKADGLNAFLCTLPPQALLRALCFTGYQGLYLNRLGYAGGPDFEALIDEFARELDAEAFVSEDGQMYFFNLTDYGEKLRASCTEKEWKRQKKAVRQGTFTG
jgi:phosphoglycerol transferase